MVSTMLSTDSTTTSSDDPLQHMLAPPPNETHYERDVRLRLEAEAKRISDAIDEQIKADAVKRRKKVEVKLLLLGQSASGKSTLQKQVSVSPLCWWMVREVDDP